MSRIGRKFITVPEGVEVKVDNGFVVIKHKNVELREPLIPGIEIAKEGNVVRLKIADAQDRRLKAFYGLLRSLVQNMVRGVHKGYEKKLNIVGVGYKADVKGKVIDFALGYSHAITFPLPEGIQAAFDKNTNSLTIKGVDRRLVGEVAAQIRRLRPPEVYKGKGVMYANEVIRRKVGKTGTK